MTFWRGAVRMACGAAGLAVVLGTVTVVMHWMNRTVDTSGLKTELWTATVLQTFAWAAAGALIVTKRPRNPFGWLFCGASLAAAATALGSEYAVYTLLTPGHDLPGGQWALWLSNWSWVLYIGVIPAVLLVFPDGRLLSRRWAPVLGVAALATAVLLIAQIFRPGAMVADATSLATIDNPVGIAAWGDALTEAHRISDTVLDLVLIVGVVSLLLRFRRARGEERLQLKWLASVAVFLPVTIAMGYIAPGTPSGLAFKLHMALLICTITVAVLKYRLYDIDVILKRSLVYGALTILVLAMYVAIVAATGAVLQASAGLIPSLIATGVVAAAFNPLRYRLQRGANRLLYGARDEPYEVLSQLGQRLESTLAPDEVLPRLVETVGDALKLPYVAVEVPNRILGDDTADNPKIVASYGDDAPIALRLPLQYQGAPVGSLALAARSGDDGFTPADRRLLDDVARQAGVAVHAVALTAALQDSRERLVAALEEERRRFRRDLHDGLGPTLTAVALQIDAARNVLHSDPGSADELLVQLRAEVKASIEGIRRLVYDLRPPALDELGLVRALREQAAGFVRAGSGRVDGLRVTVEAPADLPPLPAAVEVAAYRIGAEAVTNVARHANANHCLLRISMNGALEVQVVDDGVGTGATWMPGVGLASMRERASELGGTLSVEASPEGGTRVLAKLPLRER